MPSPPPTSDSRRAQALHELLRMVRAVIRDGRVSALEAEFLRFWFAEHRDLLEGPPLEPFAGALGELAQGEGDLDPEVIDALTELLEEDSRPHGERSPPVQAQ